MTTIVTSPEPLLRVSNLRTRFRAENGEEAHAVDGVSFRLAEGEALGLVGESGCGKTVTALSIMGLVSEPGKVVKGSSVHLAGEELVGADQSRLRGLRGNEMSMIFQEPMTSLNPVFTVGDQVAEVLRLHRSLSRPDAAREAERLLDEVGIQDAARTARDYPHQLSGGMRQRAMIAMALACEPRLLIADEPTTALDVTTQAQILELLAELRRARGMAVLLISHDLGVVAELCDRVAVMYAGQIVETGQARDVLRDPRHPYTQGLLGSLPGRVAKGARLAAIPGTVPGPEAWPSGCRFHERCSVAFERCAEDPPELLEVGQAGRCARCWLVKGVERAAPVVSGREA